MQVSKRKINRQLISQLRKMLLGILADIRTPEEMKVLLDDLLTETEIMVILKRLGIAVYLDKGRNYDNIKDNLKVSSATIAAIAEKMGGQGIEMAIKRIKADQWAKETSSKIVKSIRKILPV